MPRVLPILRFLIIFILLYPLGLLTHEVIGHGLPGLAFGSKPTALHMLGLDLYPRVKWVGWQGGYGYASGTPIPPGWRMHVVSLGGSMSTALAAAVALYFLWKKPRKGFTKLALISISLWWLDLFTYTLPTWGIRRSILWGKMYAEPYEAAVALGMPGPLFQFLVIAAAGFYVFALIQILCAQKRGPSSEFERAS